MGLCLLPDGGRDQLPHLPHRQRPLGRRQPEAEQLCRPRHHRRRRAGRQLSRRQHRRAGADPAPRRLFRRAHRRAGRRAHAPEAGRHPRHHGEQEGSHHLRRSGASLGRRQALRRLDRMGGEQFPSAVLQRRRSRRGCRADACRSGEARRRRAEAGAGRQPRWSREAEGRTRCRDQLAPVRTIWSAADADPTASGAVAPQPEAVAASRPAAAALPERKPHAARRAGGHRADHSDRRRAASRSGCDCGPGGGAGNGERRPSSRGDERAAACLRLRGGHEQRASPRRPRRKSQARAATAR